MSEENSVYKAGIIISSDRAYNGTYEDKSGPALTSWLSKKSGFELGDATLVPDEQSEIENRIVGLISTHDLVIISGGTGLGPRDVSPQAAENISDYNVPGIGELLRMESLKFSFNAPLSRCGAWIKDQKLILALPGNPKAVTEQLDILDDLLPHILDSLNGKCKHRRRVKSDD